MDRFSQEPTPGKKGGHQKWDYLSVENGLTTCGFLAAYPLGVQCHHLGGSKPCLLKFTHGALPCKMCSADKPPEWRGFTAIWDREYVPRFVVITEDYCESVREIPLKSLIKISRAKTKYSPCVIRADQWRTQPLPPNARRDVPVDLIPALLRQWKLPELTLWYFEQLKSDVGVTPVSLTTPVPPAIAERSKLVTLPSEEQIEAQLDKVMAHLTHKGKSLERAKPSRNGHGPPKPEGQ